MFTLKDIDGAVVEKRKIIPWTMGYKKDADYFNLKNGLYNEAIDAQSSVKLRFNREKLAEVIFKNEYPSHDWNTQGPGINSVKERCRIDADAIIAADKEIIEVEP